MKRNIFALAGAGLAVASLAIFTSCEENKLEETPTVTLEKVSEDLNSVSFSVSATNASEVAYVQQEDLTSVPSAKGIITAGVKVSASEPQTVTISDCTPGTTYYIAAAAVSSGGSYSEVVTLSLTAAGTDCNFEVGINAANDESISYTVTPTDETVPYVVSVLPFTEYENASDEEIFDAIVATITSSAETEGQSFAEYLSSIEVSGVYSNTLTGLTPETSYYIAAVGISPEGTQATPLVKETASTTAETPEMKFEMTVSDVTDYSATLLCTPNSNTGRYVRYYYPASNFGIDINEGDADFQEKANQVAEKMLESQGGYLDQGIGLVTGPWSYNVTDLMMDTKYYFFAFAYEPGLGRQSNCELVVFTTEHGYSADEFEAEIVANTVTSTMISASVRPAEGREGIYWAALAMPKDSYSAEEAVSSLDAQVDELVKIQHDAGFTTYTKLDAVTSNFMNGRYDYVEIMGLTPATDYVLAVVPFNTDGTANPNVRTMDFTTPTAEKSNASCELELVGLYDADAVYAEGIFEGMTDPAGRYYVAAVKVTKNEDVKYCQYMTASGGDRTQDYESEYNTDDYLLTWTWTPIDMSSFDENGVTYLFLRYQYYGDPVYGPDNTLMVIARDSEDPNDQVGVWGRSSRMYIKVDTASDPQLGDVSELASLVESLGGGSAK